jgi:hypothetical protein
MKMTYEEIRLWDGSLSRDLKNQKDDVKSQFMLSIGSVKQNYKGQSF